MNTGQMIMSLGAMMLLATIMLRVNTANLTNESVRDDAQFGVLATSLATSLIEQAHGLAFDEKSDTNAIYSVSDLSSVLGPESGEGAGNFDDFDDYNGFTKRDSTMPSEVFDISCSVVYVDQGHIKGLFRPGFILNIRAEMFIRCPQYFLALISQVLNNFKTDTGCYYPICASFHGCGSIGIDHHGAIRMLVTK